MARQRTEALTRVAIVMLDDSCGRHYGYELSTQAHVRTGVLYPMLDRMLQDQWVTAEWELPGETTARRRRRYYTLTDLGRRELGAIADAARSDVRFAFLFGLAT